MEEEKKESARKKAAAEKGKNDFDFSNNGRSSNGIVSESNLSSEVYKLNPHKRKRKNTPALLVP